MERIMDSGKETKKIVQRFFYHFEIFQAYLIKLSSQMRNKGREDLNKLIKKKEKSKYDE